MTDQINPQINLKNTTPYNGLSVYQSGFILRKVSKFIIGSDEDSLIPVPVLFNIKTGEVLQDTLPPSIAQDYAQDSGDSTENKE